MKLNIRLFAAIKARAETSQLSIEISEPATVSDLLDELFRQYPTIQPFVQTVLVAVNQEYVNRSQLINPGDEIALFPPVSGG
ncbi:MAG: molybdopterin converting factor subunit 1 [Chloroflexi bacterium]|nr:MAG: molybdopterin converting factor subunit 1 [Chloroflexota bacterium]